MMKTKQQIDPDVLDRVASTLKVLAHPHRLRIVELLMANRLSVGELAEQLDLAPAAVSQHLNHMRAFGILDVKRKGRTAHYFVVSPNAKNVIQCIRRHHG